MISRGEVESGDDVVPSRRDIKAVAVHCGAYDAMGGAIGAALKALERDEILVHADDHPEGQRWRPRFQYAQLFDAAALHWLVKGPSRPMGGRHPIAGIDLRQHLPFEVRLAQNELDKLAAWREDRQKVAAPAVARNLTGIARQIVKRRVERFSRRSIQANYAILPALGNNQCFPLDYDAGGERQAVGQPMAFARKFNE